jgi:hypothetical protein
VGKTLFWGGARSFPRARAARALRARRARAARALRARALRALARAARARAQAAATISVEGIRDTLWKGNWIPLASLAAKNSFGGTR